MACQFSSIGSLNEKWLTGEFLASASAGMDTSGALLGTPRPGREGLQLVWPTEEEVRWSVEGWMAGASIPGSEQNVSKAFLRPLW